MIHDRYGKNPGLVDHDEGTGISGVWGAAPVWLRLCRVRRKSKSLFGLMSLYLFDPFSG